MNHEEDREETEKYRQKREKKLINLLFHTNLIVL